jgi:hypothetical protein
MNKTEQRFEAAKAAMQGILANGPLCHRVMNGDLRTKGVQDDEQVARIARHMADALLAELAHTEPAEQCQWTRDEDGIYSTSCGGMWEFTDGSYQDNSVKFCPYCGKGIAEPTCKDSLHVPDADGWVVRVPTDPIPDDYSAVKFRDGVELIASRGPWRRYQWEHKTRDRSFHITHYRPA